MFNIKNTICDLLIQQTKSHPNDFSIGSIEKKKVVFSTFKQYKDGVEHLSLALTSLGVKHQSKICILSNTCKKWHYFDLAIMCSGAITIPIYPSYTSEEVEFIINHSDAEFIIIENNEQLQKLIDIQGKIRVKTIITLEYIDTELKNKLSDKIQLLNYDECISIGILQSQSHPDQFHYNIENISPTSTATIVYTSGTTGEPKGAVIKHEALFQVLANVKKFTHNSINSKDRFLTYLPLSHVLGRLESFFPLIFGCQAVYATDMKKLLENIPLVKPTLLVAVPRVLEKIYEKAMKTINQSEIKSSVFNWANGVANNYHETIARDMTPKTACILQYQLAKKAVFEKIYNMFGGNIRYFISGGAPLSTTIIEFLRNSNLTVLEGYGLTETVAPCFLNPLNKQVPGTVGHPMGDVEVNFAADGEILIKSKALFSEYYKNPIATKKAFTEDGWFRSGDIGEFNSSGFLKITDRKKDIIITSGGKNIAPQKLENQLKLITHISQSIIIGDQRKYLTALIALDSDSLRALKSQLKLDKKSDIKHLSNHPQVISHIQSEIDDLNTKLASYETIKKFKILPIEIDTTNYLTPSLKIKKKVILKDYKSLIESMYK